MNTEDQLADILTIALGKVKFLELYLKSRVKKAWDKKKIKEEDDGSDFPSICTAGTRGTRRRAPYNSC